MRAPARGWLLAALLLLAGAAPATAQEEGKLEPKVSGSLRVRGLHLANGTLPTQLDPVTRSNLKLSGNDEIDDQQTFLDTRLRLQLSVTAVQEVTAFLAIEVGDITFGDKASGGGLGTDGRVFENKNLYLEWHPVRYSFKVRAGLYPKESDLFGLVLSDDVAGVHGEMELLGTKTVLHADFIKAVENSRRDLDGDGLVDNDYKDRTLFLGRITSTAVPLVGLEAFGIADIDHSLGTPVGDTQQDVYWLGLTATTSLGPAQLTSTAIWAYGRRKAGTAPGVTIKGFAVDTRLRVELPFVTVQAIFAYASGRDPRRNTTDEGFPTINPFYGVSGIVYSNFGGFNATGSNLSGTGHATLKLSASVSDIELELLALWAFYTSDRDVSGNVNRFNRSARDLGFELDLNASYELVAGFKAFVRTSVFFPGKGYEAQFDTRRHGVLGQVIVGAQFSF